ncbi:MAG: septal ring lytic transglycosylase RlpA family protein [Firmicutes bacterium]|nr:septal ring lytic transglycosylase RlpA family protein [Bacillota bacterium]
MNTKVCLGLTAAILTAALSQSGSLVCPKEEQAPAEPSYDPVKINWTKSQGQLLAEILLNGKVVLRIRSAAGRYTLRQRGEIVAQRLRSILAAGADPEAIELGIKAGEIVVRLEDTILITVDRENAKANKIPAPYLALVWANNLRSSLGADPLNPAEAFYNLGRGQAVTARASWYGPRFHGRPTASGEIYDQNVHTAAHRTLPFGTLVVVTNPASGKTVLVRINDRGPFIAGRSIDLSRAAARELGMEAAGVADVQMTVLGP